REQLELGSAVAALVVAQDLVVRAVLAHQVEDVLDLSAARRSGRDYGRSGWRLLEVHRAELLGGLGVVDVQLPRAGEGQHAGGTGDDRGEVAEAADVVVAV